MVIKDCDKICEGLLKQSQVQPNENSVNLNCKVYIDGASFLEFNYPERGFRVPEQIAKSANNIYKKVFDDIKTIYKFNIESTVVYFLGQFPAIMRCSSSCFLPQVVESWSSGLVEDKSIELKQLEIGEGKIECYVQRDINFASIIVTNDFDTIPICYKHKKKSDNDDVFLYILKNEALYNAELLTTRLDKNAFILLLHLLGSKYKSFLVYTKPFFTTSMVEFMLEILNSNKIEYIKLIEHINEITNNDNFNSQNMEKCMGYFIWLLCNAKKNKLGTFALPPKSGKIQAVNYFELIEWFVLYFNQGKDVKNYSNDFVTYGEGVLKFNYIVTICKNVFPDSFFPNEKPPNNKQLQGIISDIPFYQVIQNSLAI